MNKNSMLYYMPTLRPDRPDIVRRPDPPPDVQKSEEPGIPWWWFLPALVFMQVIIWLLVWSRHIGD